MADLKSRTIAATYSKLLYTSTDDGLEGNTGATTSVITTDDGDGSSTASCLNLGINRIGIGVSAPDTDLHISSTGDCEVKIEADSGESGENNNPRLTLAQDGDDSRGYFGMTGNASTLYNNSLANAVYVEAKNNEPDYSAIQFVTGGDLNAPVAGYPRMTIAAGNAALTDNSVCAVGIGNTNTTPNSTLHIQGNAVTNAEYDEYVQVIIEATEARLELISGHGGHASGVILSSVVGSNDINQWVLQARGDSTGSSGVVDSFAIGYNDAQAGGTDAFTVADGNEIITVTPSKRVGIGVTNPTTTLAVVGSFSTGLVTLTATDAITALEHAGRTLSMADVGGNTDCVFTLPAATGTGNVYKFVVGVVNTSTNGYKIQVVGNDTIDGTLVAVDDDGAGNAASVKHWPTAADSDTITLDGDTTGGAAIGDWIELTDLAADQWVIKALVNTSGTIATPFSAAVS